MWAVQKLGWIFNNECETLFVSSEQEARDAIASLLREFRRDVSHDFERLKKYEYRLIINNVHDIRFRILKVENTGEWQ
jgi:hypothetical protein